ncbi:MAG: 1-(5-phosphoribosyl)-5-[(5-phosphoribosylamino)methylideneamino]imidazole-4-carboxamide isomerase [Clostridia bacterium]|nr:1-(5-phosphoribosyl)-5-[(5-phosphoribosylamino)methylideneamino]imidazole-4-carboxamide isomerase [Clostridia bacterium]
MRIYPAIDIKDGKCVRLFKGDYDKVTVYGDSPREMAVKWATEGGEFIHVVDLDGAKAGTGVNAEIISEICKSVSVPVQTGGGIRTMADVENKIASGVNRVIIGTKAVRDESFVKDAVEKYGDKIVIGIDAKDGMVAVEGWEEVSEFGAVEFAKKMESLGVKTIVYTDIATDGTLRGPNVEAMREMASSVNMDVIASGGIGNIEHIKSLLDTGVEGVIVGKALYTDSVALADAIKVGKGNEND